MQLLGMQIYSAVVAMDVSFPETEGCENCALKAVLEVARWKMHLYGCFTNKDFWEVICFHNH